MASLALNETGMEDCGIDDSFKYNLYSVVYSVVFVLGLITNCAALFVFCFRMKMRNETTMFMTNLALSDLVFVFTLPFKVFYNVNRHWPFGDGLCKVSGTAFITNIYGSMLFLTCISVDRFLAIVYPFRSRAIRTRRNAALVCAAVWLTIVGGGISVTFFSTINSTSRATTCFEGFSKSTWRTYLSKITIFIEVSEWVWPVERSESMSTRSHPKRHFPSDVSDHQDAGGSLPSVMVMAIQLGYSIMSFFCLHFSPLFHRLWGFSCPSWLIWYVPHLYCELCSAQLPLLMAATARDASCG